MMLDLDKIRCPYCKMQIMPLDVHASGVKNADNYIDGNNIRPQIQVTCMIIRNYVVNVEEKRHEF